MKLRTKQNFKAFLKKGNFQSACIEKIFNVLRSEYSKSIFFILKKNNNSSNI